MARILVVDDDKDILKIAERVLAHGGHAAVVAEDAMKAMEILNATTFDMLISDANMPHYSGFDLIKTIRNQEHLKNISIVMLTGLRERKDVEKAIHAGADDYIVKPIDPLLLMQKVNSLFEKRPPTHHPGIVFAENGPMNSGLIQATISVLAISELGVKIKTDLPLPEGATVDLRGYFFEHHLDIEPPPCRVLSQRELRPNSYELQLIFVGANEYQLRKIRQWVFSHGSMIRRENKSAA
ncbi:MAG: response regulator [Bdellovibrionales bacterium]|nr:response regulator [Bdellovibrionales bacterium]